MNASADLQVPLTSPRCGCMQSEMVPNVAPGQNCLMSPAHCCAVQTALDRMVEQPTESWPTWDCKQASTRPPPGLTSAHRDWTSVVQSRSEVNNPSWALALREPVSINAPPSAIAVTLSAIIENDFDMAAFPCVSLPADPSS
jgi:hypothetical protein